MWQLRPTFVLTVAAPRRAVLAAVRLAARQSDPASGRFVVGEEYGEIHLPVGEHRLWSPHLSFSIGEETEVAGGSKCCRIDCRFAPRHQIWSAVWAGYLAFSFTAFFSLIFACAQQMLGRTLWGVWIAAASMLGLATLYVTAAVGQQWSSDQMDQLRRRLEEVLADATEPASPTPPQDPIDLPGESHLPSAAVTPLPAGPSNADP